MKGEHQQSSSSPLKIGKMDFTSQKGLRVFSKKYQTERKGREGKDEKTNSKENPFFQTLTIFIFLKKKRKV